MIGRRVPALRRAVAACAMTALLLLAVACGRTNATPTSVADLVTPTVAVAATGPSGGATATATPPATATPTSQTGVATPTAVVRQIVALQPIPAPPARDLYDLGRRLRLRQAEEVARFVDPPPAPMTVGQQVEWNVNRDAGNVTVTARVMAVSENAYWLFETGSLPTQSQVDAAVAEFESNTWPVVTAAFGTPWTPGVDGDPRIVVFHGRLRTGVGGYYSSADEYPRLIVPDSNERETIYMSSNITPGSQGYNGVLAHELQHAIHWAHDPSEESWVNEGLSEYAALIAGYPPGSVNSFIRNPGVSLTEWAHDISVAGANYGAAGLFMEYMAAHYGRAELISALVRDPLDGYGSVDNTLVTLGYPVKFEDVFADWVIANYLDEESGPYSYPGRTLGALASSQIGLSNTISASVRPFGADYYVAANALGEVTFTFDGETTAPLFGAQPYSGDTCWWTNAGDSINTRLVREVDLSTVGSATLMGWSWYEIEEDWDYVYITVSTDGGVTWETVRSNRSRSTNPNGNSYGHGITGRSGDWVLLEADLSAFVGREILLALEYITDDAIHERGGCFDNFSIPEIGWFDDTTDDGGWRPYGFARVNNLQPQKYLVQVIRKRVGQPVEIVRVPVDEMGRGSVLLPGVERTESVVVVVSAIQRGVTGRADYAFRLERD